MALGCNTAAVRIRRKMSVSTPPVCLLRWPVCWSTPGTVQREHGFTNGSLKELVVPSTRAFISSSSKALQPSMWRFVLKRSIPICGPPSWATLVQKPTKCPRRLPWVYHCVNQFMVRSPPCWSPYLVLVAVTGIMSPLVRHITLFATNRG